MLEAFQHGVKEAEAVGQRLRGGFEPPMLSALDSIRNSSVRRIWWASEAPELDEMPWELMFQGLSMPSSANFVRGFPPATSPPILPLSGPLRILWTDWPTTPQWMRDLFTHPDHPPGIEYRRFTGPLRLALREAASSGIELLHCCADGGVSLSFDGTLRDPMSNDFISASEIAEGLKGSRVSVLGLTPPEMASGPAKGSYRAFASIGTSRFPLPSIIAPLGPCSYESSQFWLAFYEEFSQGYH